MEKFLIHPKNIVTVNADDEFLINYAVEVNGNTISRIAPFDEFNLAEYNKIYDFPNYTLIPGFVQTHVHLCQTLFRGLADDLELLDWLQKKIFPFENSHGFESLRRSAQLGIYELQTGGTTTILDMGTINHHEAVFGELGFSGMRAFSGKCMVDENDLLPKFKESTSESLKKSFELAEEFHGKENGRLNYAFAPRFVLSCSEELLKETYSMLNDFPGTLYHTHASENKGEIEAVKTKTGMDNIEYFNSIGVLGNRTILAHGIHVNESEVKILKETETRIAHCPSANLKLASGIANVPNYLDEGVSISIGADGPPCNNNLSQFTEMRLASLIQKPLHGPTSMNSKTVFRLATIEGAKALGIADKIGSIEVGKKADLVLLDLNTPAQPLIIDDENIYSTIIYTSSRENVRNVFIDGREVVSSGESLVYDKDEIYREGKKELRSLLKRAQN